MKSIVISACLLGRECRYDGKSKPCQEAIELGKKYKLIPICPEVDGGLPTPRVPSERIGARVMMRDGSDVTENYNKGARAALKACLDNDCNIAVLKERSPSCGKGAIYDGTFTGTLTVGNGVAAELLIANGISVYGESEIYKLLEENA